MFGRQGKILATALALLAICVMAGGAADTQRAPEAIAPGPGVELVRSRCTLCHSASMFTTRHLSARRWSGVVDQMIARGAPVSDKEVAPIVAYLATAYGPPQ
jgi:hypothetical protein